MDREPIATDRAPAAIGTYSQGIRAGKTVYLSGQIPLDPERGELVEGDIEAEVTRVFENLFAVAAAAGCGPSDIVKLTVYLTDLAHFQSVNAVMERHFSPPYPARAAVQVAALPRGARVEVEGIAAIP